MMIGQTTRWELPGGQIVEIIHESVMDSPFNTGDEVFLELKTEKINVFTRDGRENLSHEQ